MNTQNKFLNDIESRVDYFRKEFELTYLEAIGALTHIATMLSIEVNDRERERGDKNDEEKEDWDGD